MKIKFPLSIKTEATITLAEPNRSHGLTKVLTSAEFDSLETGIGALREQITGETFVPDTEPAAFGDSVLVDVNTLRYAATALESSSDRGDRYAASQIRDALREPHATYGSDE
ncbi:hypothetical protein SEA_MAGRITTE_195 [Microbacterium phage Magritte]|nr:hypothetical protein SEA_MAGRITTE_195 [Microbacterium phage Magritte]